jgi:single-stranded DNA-binding protein
VNKVLLAGRLTRDPEMRALASGKHVTQVPCSVHQPARIPTTRTKPRAVVFGKVLVPNVDKPLVHHDQGVV